MSPLSRSSSRKSTSLLRRANTVSSAAPTKSELLAPDEKKKQAMAAAKHAFGEETDRRLRGSQSSAEMRPRLSEINLNKLHLNRRPSVKRPSARQTTVASSIVDNYQHSENYGFSRAPSTVDDDPRHYEFDDDSTNAGDYESTVVRRRRSMRWHRGHVTPTRGQRDLGMAELDTSFASPDYSPPQLGSSTPSSFRRVRKTRSAFTVSPTFPPPSQDISPVVYAAESSPQKNDSDYYSPTKDYSRKSMSFLRGGTDFMGEGKSRERRSYYMESSQRRGCPPIIPEAVGKYKGKNAKGEWGAVRFSVKKKARKISESVFGSVRRVFGMDFKGTVGTIPEQHVPSTRMHFRDYITPEEVFGEQNFAAPGKFGSGNKGTKEKPKIRSNYVISKPPTLHLVPSHEMIRSDVGSIRDLTPPSSFGRKFSGASIGTVSTGTWNSTIASRMTSRTLRENPVDKRDLAPVLDRHEAEYFQLPKRERHNVDARRVYSAVVKKLYQDKDKTAVQPVQETGYYMTPGIGLLPEEEGIFERHSAPQSGRSSLKRKSSDATIKPEAEPEPYEFGPESPPPPVPKIPKVWLENEIAKTFDETSVRYSRGIQLGVPLAEPHGVKRSLTNYERPSSESTSTVLNRNTVSKKASLVEGGDPPNPWRSTSTSEEASRSVDTFASSTDAALSACHLQMQRRLTPRICASNENLHRGLVNKRLSYLEAGEGIRRSRSVLEYHNPNVQCVERTRVAMEYEKPLTRNLLGRSNLRDGSDENSRIITKRTSKASLSGRVSRLSMRECDVGLAVARQFGPVIGQPAEDRRFLPYGYGRREEQSVNGDYDSAFL